MTITLPEYEDAQARIVNGTGSMLDWFITEHEPGGVPACPKFRRELILLLEEQANQHRDHFLNMRANRDFWRMSYRDLADLKRENERCANDVNRNALIFTLVMAFVIGLMVGMAL